MRDFTMATTPAHAMSPDHGSRRSYSRKWAFVALSTVTLLTACGSPAGDVSEGITVTSPVETTAPDQSTTPPPDSFVAGPLGIEELDYSEIEALGSVDDLLVGTPDDDPEDVLDRVTQAIVVACNQRDPAAQEALLRQIFFAESEFPYETLQLNTFEAAMEVANRVQEIRSSWAAQGTEVVDQITYEVVADVVAVTHDERPYAMRHLVAVQLDSQWVLEIVLTGAEGFYTGGDQFAAAGAGAGRTGGEGTAELHLLPSADGKSRWQVFPTLTNFLGWETPL